MSTPGLTVCSPISVWAASGSSHRCVRGAVVNREEKHMVIKGSTDSITESLVLGRLSLWGGFSPHETALLSMHST